MRKSFTKILLAAVAFCTALSAKAYDYEIDGVFYSVISESDKTVEVVTGNKKYAGDITIPSSIDIVFDNKTYAVASVGDNAFSDCTGLTSVTLGSGVTSIGESAFFGCTGLTSITIPNGVTTIGNSAFERCSNLVSVTLSKALETIGDLAFSECSSLASITIPDGVTTIGYMAFSKCSSLTSVNIPDGVISIGNLVFSECRSLASVTLGRGLEIIGNYAFDGCMELNEITCNAAAPPSLGYSCFYDIKTAYSLNVPDESLELYKATPGWKEFLYDGYFIVDGVNYAITSTSKRTVDVYRFNTNSANVIIPATVEYDDRIYTVTSIGDYVFRGCSSLVSVTIPDVVTSIGEEAFYECGLTSITLPDGVNTIGGGSFYNCI